MTIYNKPIPVADEVSKEFWEAAKRHDLVVQRCKQCSQYNMYPKDVCPHCLTPNLEWVKASGRGRVYSYSVIHQPLISSFNDDVPYVYAIIELAEGPRLSSNVVECKPEDVKVNMPVTAIFDDVTPEVTLIKFKPAE
jgi:uncharacterized OB-fold protein